METKLETWRALVSKMRVKMVLSTILYRRQWHSRLESSNSPPDRVCQELHPHIHAEACKVWDPVLGVKGPQYEFDLHVTSV